MATLKLKSLREHATTQSFSRGKSYYKGGSVKKVAQKGNNFSAKVYGSSTYKTSITVSSGDLYSYSCSCPYDWGGICKHIVALGLAVIDQKGIVQADSPPDSLILNAHESLLQGVAIDEFFDKIFMAATAPVRLSFLKQLFLSNTDLQLQFAQYSKENTNTKKKEKAVNIDVLKKSIYNTLCNLDFDFEEEYEDYEYDYYDEGEDFDGKAIEQIKEEVFDDWIAKVNSLIKKGDLLNAVSMLLALYEASSVAKEPDSDYDIFYDGYVETLLEIFETEMKTVIETMVKVVKSQASVEKIIDLFIDRYNFYKEKKGEGDFQNLSYSVKLFEDFLISLIIDEKIAKYLKTKLTKNKLNTIKTAYVFLEIAEITNNDKSWLRTAKKFAMEDVTIARQLLVHYDIENQSDDFYELAQKAFKKWPNQVDSYLLKKTNPEIHKSLYIKALMNFVKRKKDLEKYKELSQVSTEAEKNNFLISIQGTTDFYASVLSIEERFEEILELINKQYVLSAPRSTYWLGGEKGTLRHLISLIIDIYPKECFEILSKKAKSSLQTGRGRPLYQQIVQEIDILLKIKDNQTTVKDFFKELYNWNPRLSALRDEMKKGGLV